MFDQHMICEDTVANVAENGAAIGFSFGARLPYYRGLGLSMVEDVAVTLDGEAIPREAMRLTLRGRTWTLDEMENEHGDRWNFGEVATVTVLKDGGLSAGEHRLELAERMRISYLPFVPTTRCVKTISLAA